MDGRVLARKDVPLPSHVDKFVEQIRTLGQLHLSKFIVGLYGVILTEDQKRIKASLTLFCERGTLKRVIDNNAGKLSWSRREKWARQLVIGLSDVHNIGTVHGGLALSRIGLADDDDIRILGSGSWGMNRSWAPPEIVSLIRSQRKIPTSLGPASDIYQLGMVLWALASQVGEPESAAKPLRVTTEMGAPAWYKRIVESCLSSDPRERPSATSLLDMWWDPEDAQDNFDDQDLWAESEASSSKPASVVDDDDPFETASVASIATSISAHSTYTVVVKDATSAFADLFDECMDLANIMQKALEQQN